MCAAQVAHPMVLGFVVSGKSVFPNPGSGSRDEFSGFEVGFQSLVGFGGCPFPGDGGFRTSVSFL